MTLPTLRGRRRRRRVQGWTPAMWSRSQLGAGQDQAPTSPSCCTCGSNEEVRKTPLPSLPGPQVGSVGTEDAQSRGCFARPPWPADYCGPQAEARKRSKSCWGFSWPPIITVQGISRTCILVGEEFSWVSELCAAWHRLGGGRPRSHHLGKNTRRERGWCGWDGYTQAVINKEPSNR